MKISVNTQAFLRQFKIAASAVTTKSRPGPQYVRLTATIKTGIMLAAEDSPPYTSDLLEVQIAMGGTILQEGSMHLPVKETLKILGRIKSTETILGSDPKDKDHAIAIHATVGSKNTEYILFGEKPSNTSEISRAETYHSLPCTELQRAIKNTLFAVADAKHVRESIKGIHFETEGGKVHAVATNGVHLARQPIAGSKAAAMPPATITKNAVKLLEKILKETTCGEVQMTVTDRTMTYRGDVLFQIGNTLMHSQSIPQKFPDWRSILPKPEKFLQATVGCVNLLNALTTFDAEEVQLVFTKERLTIESEKGEVPIASNCKGKATVKFHTANLVSMLKAYLSSYSKAQQLLEECTFTMNGIDVVKVTAKHGFTYVIMPVCGMTEAIEYPVTGENGEDITAFERERFRKLMEEKQAKEAKEAKEALEAKMKGEL